MSLQTQYTPAYPKVADMLGSHIEYIHARPYQRPELIETGIVIGYQFHCNELFLRVQPDKCNRLAKWVSEFDFRRYVREAVLS